MGWINLTLTTRTQEKGAVTSQDTESDLTECLGISGGGMDQQWLEQIFIGWINLTLPRWLSGRESACQCRGCKRRRFSSWVKKIPWSRKWQPTVVLLPGKFHGEENFKAVYCHPAYLTYMQSIL